MKTEIQSKLDENIPRDVISNRTQAGVELSYLEGWYVIDRLNQVLGTENWSHNIVSLMSIPGESIAFNAHVRLTAVIDGKVTTKDGIGYGKDKPGRDKNGNVRAVSNPGEMAAKEAETDALKRAAMKFGRSLGLALYDKSQEYIDDEKAAEGTSRILKADTEIHGDTGDIPATSNKGSKTSTKTIRQTIKQAFKVLQAQKKLTKEQFATMFTGGAKVDSLTDDQATGTLSQIKVEFPELGL